MSTGKIMKTPLTALLLLAGMTVATPVFAQADESTAAPAADATGAAPGEEALPGTDEAIPGEEGVLPGEEGIPGEGDMGAEVAPMQENAEVKQNPYGLGHVWETGDWVSKTVLGILAIMFAGTWYLFFTKVLSQSRLIAQGKTVNARFYQAGSLDEGLSRLERRSAFRSLAEDGQNAAAHYREISTHMSLADWIATALNRSIDDLNSQLQGGNAFLATVASTAPFVGLFGTVWGILHALLNIGISGQPSIDKVAGPVGEALIMTAIGLAVAVPAVFCYNIVLRRNKQITDRLRSFGTDVEALLLGATPGGAEAERGGRRR